MGRRERIKKKEWKRKYHLRDNFFFFFQFSVSISGFSILSPQGEILAGKGTFLREWRLYFCPLQCLSCGTNGTQPIVRSSISASCTYTENLFFHHQRYLVVKDPSPWGNPNPTDQNNSKTWSNSGNPSTDNFPLKSWNCYTWKGPLRSSRAAVIPAPTHDPGCHILQIPAGMVTPPLPCPLRCSTALWEKKDFLISDPNLPWCHLGLSPHVLLLLSHQRRGWPPPHCNPLSGNCRELWLHLEPPLIRGEHSQLPLPFLIPLVLQLLPSGYFCFFQYQRCSCLPNNAEFSSLCTAVQIRILLRWTILMRSQEGELEQDSRMWHLVTKTPTEHGTGVVKPG